MQRSQQRTLRWGLFKRLWKKSCSCPESSSPAALDDDDRAPRDEDLAEEPEVELRATTLAVRAREAAVT